MLDKIALKSSQRILAVPLEISTGYRGFEIMFTRTVMIKDVLCIIFRKILHSEIMFTRSVMIKDVTCIIFRKSCT